MRTPLGWEPGQGALPILAPYESANGEGQRAAADSDDEDGPLSVEDLLPPAVVAEESPPEQPLGARPAPGRSRGLPTIAPDPTPDGQRSRFDPDAGVVFYNENHADFLMVKSDPQSLLDYLATLVAKEYVVYNNPRAAPDEFAEEMVRMLVRVRRHLPKKL